MKIALDVNGGDNAPWSTLQGTALFLENSLSSKTKIVLVGDEEKILFKTRSLGINLDLDSAKPRVEFISAKEIIAMDEPKPSLSFKNKPESSLVKSISLVKERKCDAVISAGNTAALLSSSLFLLGKMEGIRRPALATFIPTMDGGFVLCDVGANIDVKPIHLLQYALMASDYTKYMNNINSPRVGLLNIGQEKNKGSKLYVETNKLLEDNLDNFVGNIEPRYLMENKADVIICDGFSGNIVLKLTEGLINHLQNWITSDNKLKSINDNNSIDSIFNNYNYEEHGCSPFLGVKGIVLKCHGACSEISIKNALKSAEMLHESKLLNKIKSDINDRIEIS